MYKNYNMSQLTLPIETEITFPENDVSTIINHLVESISDSEFNDYCNHIGALFLSSEDDVKNTSL
ncbi:hypothetical protein [Staphylococcus hyicus]|uniref:hypothetical protein n=1 Tax=Staphylococcus hyicus TaxID=1284 RepID=UPI002366A83D|nr:hypothetical protein [Staphylococcus hyicus]